MLRRIYNFGYYCDLLSGWKETHSVNDPYWSLSYRERKHEENLSHGRSRVHKEKREIALLLDVHALDGISDETCTLFINQVDFIRRYFKASKARIVVSSYVQFPTYLKPFLDIFSKYIKPGIVVDDAYFCYGTYNFGEDKVKEQYSDATFDPFSSFEKKYLERRDGKQTVWFAVADDQLDKDLYKEYQKGKASFFCKPSLECEFDKKYDNFMSRSTKTFGFDGVVESFDSYITDLRTIRMSSACYCDYEQVLYFQREMLKPVEDYKVQALCTNKEFYWLFRYLLTNRIDDDGYKMIVSYCMKIDKDISLAEKERLKVQKIMYYVEEHFKQENSEFSLMLDKK